MSIARPIVKEDPRKARTLDEACANGDGTYNGFRLLSWLSAACTGGKGIAESEVKAIYERVKAEKAKRA